MAPLAGSMRSSGPAKSRTHSDPAPDVMLTGSSCPSPTRTVLVTRPAARSTPAIWLADQSEIQAVEPSMVTPPGWPNGSGIRARTVDGSSAGAAAVPGLPAGAAAGRLPRPVITTRTAAAIRATATATSSQRPRGKRTFSFGSWLISSISPACSGRGRWPLTSQGVQVPSVSAIRRSADVLAAAAGVTWAGGRTA